MWNIKLAAEKIESNTVLEYYYRIISHKLILILQITRNQEIPHQNHQIGRNPDTQDPYTPLENPENLQ